MNPIPYRLLLCASLALWSLWGRAAALDLPERPGAFWPQRDALKVSDIINEKLLLLDEGHCLRDQALDVCGSGSRGREEVRATSLETLRQMVAMGLGLTLLPALAVDAGPRVSKKAVEIRPFKSPPPGRTIALVWRRRAPFPETFEQLAQTLKNALPGDVEAV